WSDFKDRVKDDGTIGLPLGVRVEAAGKTIGQVQQTIEASYVPRYLKRLTVSVKNEERFFFVGGEVRTPGRIIYASGLTVLQAIDSAGGFTEFAKRTKVSLRRVNGQQFVIDCDKALQEHTIDMPVFPGDSINVPKRRW
ncbi:MAG: polysaccharide export protein, partial [Verrucomicrobia bacterium]|nr:polysaccharide export protein [Verrucomicrobiota bacterium]